MVKINGKTLAQVAADKANRDQRILDQLRPQDPRQAFENVRDPKTGLLLDQYQLDAIDPSTLEGLQAIRGRAFAKPGESEWAKLMLEQAGRQVMEQKDAAARQGLSGMQQGLMELASRGGLSSGARERMARSGARDLMAARQGVESAGIQNRFNIFGQDEQRRTDMLGKFAQAEGALAENAQKASEFNIRAALEEKQARERMEMDRYSEGMKAWAAEREAQATERSAPKGGCCFIFLEARYGDGTMDEVVRRFRDEHMTVRNQRGYYKLSEVLVPLMRKSRLVKGLVRVTMTDPLVAYGKWHYSKRGLGFLFAPVKNFWLGVFDYLGQEHPFIRESGEVV